MYRNLILLLLLLLIPMCFWGQEYKMMFTLNYHKGQSFNFNTPPPLNSQYKPELYFRHLGEQNVNLRIDFMNLKQTKFGFSSGVSFGNVKYMQPIFNSSVGIGSYNVISGFLDDYHKFSRNYFSSHLGLNYNLPLYDEKIIFSTGMNLVFYRFSNHNAQIGDSNFRDYIIFQVSKVEYNHQIEFKDKSFPIHLQIETNLKFKLNNSLYFNFGISFIGGRRFDYDYYYNFRSFSYDTEIWTELTTHKNFNHLEQPRRIDNVFFLNAGFSIYPNWQSKN